jgi:membrane protein YdbS with pleckstrin-like domain
MENLYYNLSEQEFTKGRKILLWIFASLFFLVGMGIIVLNVIFHDKSINLSLSSAPFGISLVVGIIAVMASTRRKDHFFIIDENKVEFKNGFFKPVQNSVLWSDVKEVHFPHKQKKVKLVLKNNSILIINLTWIEKKKSSHIRKHLYYVAREKNINIIKTQVIS